MLLCIIILIVVPFSYGQIRETEYECGAHGRFEYCIDGIPGCVIGCHCHPGYYFDTDTKICEPNIKLTQSFRRQFDYNEPTRRAYEPPPQPVIEEPTTMTNAVDEKIDNIAKDTDDLGDWLYNQFFKTIENQVINETKDETVPTRRGGSFPTFMKKPSRRSHKYWRARRKKKKRKKGLKNKLLRITEDDSLFDSSSGSTSDGSSDSSSSSSENSGESKEKKKDGNDHGHKKIIVFNKRPKPPLPSFIFLPNMETPFYPPIGLPPPPVPMYPMIPVPPMMGSMSFPVQTPNTQEEAPTTLSTDSDPTTSETTDAKHTSTTENNALEENVTPDNADAKDEEHPEEAPKNILRTYSKNHGGKSKPRHKMMQKLRDKFKRKNKLQNFIANEYQEPEQLMDFESPPKCISDNVPNQAKTSPIEEDIPGLQDVDFKYLSQLIHRADLNKTNHNPLPQLDPMRNMENPSPPNRRNYYNNYPNEITQLLRDLANQPVNHNLIQPTYNTPYQPPQNIPYRKKIEDTNDTYYATLGRQIASMIRNIDGDKEVDIEIEKANAKSSSNPVFNGNSYGSRSYWERSVRSPFKYFMKSFKKEMNKLKKSNENLFSLENQVEIAASTEPALTLHDLENIINKMQLAKSKLITKNASANSTMSSKTSFNVNLLPENDQKLATIRKGIINKDRQNIQYNYFPKHDYNVNIRRHITQSPILPSHENPSLTIFPKMLPETMKKNNGTALKKIFFSGILPAKKPKTVLEPHYSYKNNNFNSYTYTVLPIPPNPSLVAKMNRPFVRATTHKTYQQMIPVVLTRKKMNYYSGHNNSPYYFKNSPVPVNFRTFSEHFEPLSKVEPARKPVQPSYFHHELHHFDYFEDLL